jgi:DNA (cytosine-5)-methyltransferase 1
MIYLDGFSGYGGFRHAFQLEGWKFDKVYFSEIDKYAIANYKYNFPESEWVGSISDIRDIGKIDLFTFGWPCQDNSIAGKRKGQSGDTRSGLLFSAINCIERFKPRNFVAENVKGLLSVNKGIDIVESLKVLSFLNDSCPQYDIEMQLLNTRWFLPQNRERLFFVGHLRESGSRKIFPIGETTGIYKEEYSKNIIANCLDSSYHKGWLDHGQRTHVIVRALTERPDDIMNTITTGQSKELLINVVQKDYTKGNSQSNRVYDVNGASICLSSGGGGQGGKTGLYEVASKIRRLTPIECERLQGLMDNWTKYGDFNGDIKIISDTQRYHLCGNGVSIPPVREIAKRLKL